MEDYKREERMTYLIEVLYGDITYIPYSFAAIWATSLMSVVWKVSSLNTTIEILEESKNLIAV